MDKSSIIDIFLYIKESIELINKRFEPIKQSDDFLDSDEGIEKLDAISMRLQSIGEGLKNIQKREPSLLTSYHDKNYWSDIIKLDAEIIFDICANELSELETLIETILHDLSNS